jgi:hypothetical protein
VWDEPEESYLTEKGILRDQPAYLLTLRPMQAGDVERKQLRLNPGDTGEFDDSGIQVKLLNVYHDLTVAGGEAENASDYYRNPAVEVEISSEMLEDPLTLLIPARGAMATDENLMVFVRETKMIIDFVAEPPTDLVLVGSSGDLLVYRNGAFVESFDLNTGTLTPLNTGVSLGLVEIMEKGAVEVEHLDDGQDENIAAEVEIARDGQVIKRVLQLYDERKLMQDPHNYFVQLGEDHSLTLNVRGDYIKDWQSHMLVTPTQGEPFRHSIRVNEPLIFDGFFFYQSDWQPKVPYGQTPSKWYTILRVVHDPGLPLVYIGIALMTFGMIWAFYIGPRFRKKEDTDSESGEKEEKDV